MSPSIELIFLKRRIVLKKVFEIGTFLKFVREITSSVSLCPRKCSQATRGPVRIPGGDIINLG
jgi:hypothetical protein